MAGDVRLAINTDVLSFVMIGAAIILLFLALIIYLRRSLRGRLADNPKDDSSFPAGIDFDLAIRRYTQQPGPEVNDVSRCIPGYCRACRKPISARRPMSGYTEAGLTGRSSLQRTHRRKERNETW